MSSDKGILCDKCGKHFVISSTKERKLDNETNVSYFKCDHCQEEYRYFYNDKFVRKNVMEIKHYQKKIKALEDANMLRVHELRLKFEE